MGYYGKYKKEMKEFKPIHLRNVPPPNETFKHTQYFVFLFSYIRPENYLELGVRTGENFISLAKYCKNAIGVDIDTIKFSKSENMELHQTTTDNYFEELSDDIMFDVVFIDADHSHEQSLKDFMNVKDRIIEDGFILLHDTYPYDMSMTHPHLCNDVYKTALYIKQNFIDEFEVLTLPINPGVTMIKKIKRNKQLIYEQ